MIQQGLVQFLLARQGLVARTQDLVLEGFQFRRDESFGGFDRLAPQEVRWNFPGLTAVHLDEKPLHPIEAQLQAGETGALALSGFEIEQELLSIATQEAQLV